MFWNGILFLEMYWPCEFSWPNLWAENMSTLHYIMNAKLIWRLALIKSSSNFTILLLPEACPKNACSNRKLRFSGSYHNWWLLDSRQMMGIRDPRPAVTLQTYSPCFFVCKLFLQVTPIRDTIWNKAKRFANHSADRCYQCWLASICFYFRAER